MENHELELLVAESGALYMYLAVGCESEYLAALFI